MEHEYHRTQLSLIKRMREEFPRLSEDLICLVESHCYDDALALDLEEVNRLRRQIHYPPLTEAPRLVRKCEHAPPMPKPPPVPEQEAAFREWARDQIQEAYINAAVEGITPELALLREFASCAAVVQRNFPSIEVPRALTLLSSWLGTMRPDRIDEERVATRREARALFFAVGREIEEAVRQSEEEQDPAAQA